MPRHSTVVSTADNGTSDVSSNEWNAAIVPIKAASPTACSHTTQALSLTIAAGSLTLPVDLIEITCDNDNDADTASIGAGSAGQVVDVIIVNVSGSTTNTFTLTGTFENAVTSVLFPATGASLVGKGVRLVWSSTDSAWCIDCFYVDYPAKNIEVMTPVVQDPSALAGVLQMYSKYVAGRIVPKILGPSGVDSPLQAALWQNKIILWGPGTTTAMSSFGSNPTTAATLSNPVPATTNVGTYMRRVQFATSTTAGNASGARDIQPSNCFGSGTVKGGFFFVCRFNQGSLHTTGVQKMVGLSSSVSALGGDPSSTMADFIGMSLDAADSVWQFSRRTGTGTATKISTGVSAAADLVFELIMFVKPGTTELFVRIQQLALNGTATTILDTSYTTVVPAATTMLGLHFQVRNGALAAAHNMAMCKMYIESDY